MLRNLDFDENFAYLGMSVVKRNINQNPREGGLLWQYNICVKYAGVF